MLYWKLRSRAKCLTKGDRYSTFFYLTTSSRRRRNRITRIRGQGEGWVMKEHEIRNEIRDHFGKALEFDSLEPEEGILDSVPCQISEEMNEDLTWRVTMKKDRLAVYQLGGSKAPGPDGFPGMFYQRNWDTVGPDIFTVVRAFLEAGTFPNSLNQTDITLIPKVPNPTHASEFKPISLCNFTYKVISKVLVNMLNVYLSELITPC